MSSIESMSPPTNADEGSRSLESGHELIRQIRFLAAMAVSGAIFWYVGWPAAGPVDPRGPLTLLMVDSGGVVAMAEILGLALVSSGLAVAVCGARTAHAGPMAVAFGLAVLSLRGGNMDALVLHRLEDVYLNAGPAGKNWAVFPTVQLIAEVWLWLAAVAVGEVVGRWVESWFWPEERYAADATGPQAAAPSASRRDPIIKPVDSAAEIRQGCGAAVVTALVAFNVIRFAGGSMDEPPLKGQVYFSVGAGFFLGTLLSRWFFHSQWRIWQLTGIGLVAMAAYAFKAPPLPAPGAKTVMHVVMDPLALPLPIEYAALGTLGCLLGYAVWRQPDQQQSASVGV